MCAEPSITFQEALSASFLFFSDLSYGFLLDLKWRFGRAL